MLKADFIAQHYLIGQDWGDENQQHSHHYEFELEIENSTLNQHNYLIDIVEVRDYLLKITAYFRGQVLNELPEFANQNPSIEFLAKVVWQKTSSHLQLPTGCKVIVRTWEDKIARASYQG